MTMSYDAHPVDLKGQEDVTVVFSVPDNLNEKARSAAFMRAEDEVKSLEKSVGIMPVRRVVFSTLDPTK